DDLGIEPGRALCDLEGAILRHDKALELPPALGKPEAVDGSARAAAGPGPVLTEERGRFVGRDRELDRLRAAVDDALSGRGRLVTLVGEPGIGKTQTAVELGRYAVQRGARVLWGRCSEREGAPSYWPWVQAIRTYVGTRDGERLRVELGA